MVNKKFLIFYIVIVVVLSSCNLSSVGRSAGAITVKISSPTEGAVVTVGQEVFIVAPSVADAGITKVYFSVNGQIISTEEPDSLSQVHVSNFNWVPVAEGSVVLSVVVIDGEGQSSEPVSVNVQVLGGQAGDAAGYDDIGDGTGDNSQVPVPTYTQAPPDQPADVPTNTPPPPPTATFTPHPPTPTLTSMPTSSVGSFIVLPQIEIVSKMVSVPASNMATAYVDCPAGSTVVSGGFSINPGMYAFTHHKNDNGWIAYANNENSKSEPLNVYAVCLNFVSSATVWEEENQVAVPANSIGHAVAKCPAGTTVVGGGYTGDVSMRVYTATQIDNGYQVYAKNENAQSLLLIAHAECLSSDYATHNEMVWKGVDIPADGANGATVTCPFGQLATGGGFDGSYGLDIYHIKPEGGNTWNGYGYNTTGSSIRMNVYAICLWFGEC